MNLYASYNTGDNSWEGVRGTIWWAQTFKPEGFCRAGMVKLKVYRYGSPGTVTVGIRKIDANGKPTGSNLASASVNGNAFSESTPGSWEEILLSYVSKEDAYAIVVCAPSGNVNNQVAWRAAAPGTYADGQAWISYTSGSTWEDPVGLTVDCMFEVWGDPIRGVIIDENVYQVERGTYRDTLDKAFDLEVAIDGTFIRQEGGFDPQAWEMNVICMSRDELHSLSGSYIKTTPDPASVTYHQLPFVDRTGKAHTVYFDGFGAVEPIDRAATVFRVPIRLSRTRFP